MSVQRTIELWIANDEALYSVVRDLTRDSTSIDELARELRDRFDNDVTACKLPDVLDEILRQALAEVNWYEMADDLRQEHGMNDDEEDADERETE